MEVIIHGTGTMASIVAQCCKEQNISVSGFADELSVEIGDIIIDFSHYSRIENLLKFAISKNIPLVLATTGYSQEILVKIEEASKKIPILLSSNMSLGINLIQDILEKITPLLYASYDIELIEKHHNKKIDSPSGTAKTLLETIEKTLMNDMKRKYGRVGVEKREKNEIGVHSLRGGTIIGEHSILFCGNDELIEIKHTALSKKIFAEGAIQAARFLLGKEPNLYTMKNIFNK
ncbi:Dihydrodipicolinate reductase [Fusobacterium necrogenes]|uniref:4-hydroxy-tetrahydrodipicolinate reductase n=1 Tax=Fusobacterium necrogenes TaxID=858 RepID=A0A377GVS3_9FUSO|nr:4-hydroxy-tetrahydrodipicolinate reductase [Fusobacterium necrogenes]STO31046.1 Dihydrodipicolinate reductase [Fusobacterium necrogenes]